MSDFSKIVTYNIIVILILAYATKAINTNTTQGNHPRALLTRSDEYVTRNQKQCFESRSLVSCIKYKASKIVWKLATNGMGYFPREFGRELKEDKRYIRLIQLNEPSNILVFSDARSLDGDNELTAILKFIKRAMEIFGKNHALQIMVSSDNGMRITSNDIEARGIIKKKQRKWMILLPLIILIKIAHLKMTLVTLLLGVIGLNIIIVAGGGWLIHYLKFKTLCKIHPQLVEHHSHVYDSDPNVLFYHSITSEHSTIDDNARIQIIPNSWAAVFLAPTTALLGLVLMRLAAITTRRTGARVKPIKDTIFWIPSVNVYNS